MKKLSWNQTRPLLVPLFREAGITSCELEDEKYTDSQGQPICTKHFNSTFAHSLRRKKIAKYKGKEHNLKMAEVIVACQSCHQRLDSFDHDTTYNIVNRIIQNRLKPVKYEL